MFLEVRHLDVPEIEADELQYDEADITEYRNRDSHQEWKSDACFCVYPQESGDCYQERIDVVLYLLFLFSEFHIVFISNNRMLLEVWVINTV